MIKKQNKTLSGTSKIVFTELLYSPDLSKLLLLNSSHHAVRKPKQPHGETPIKRKKFLNTFWLHSLYIVSITLPGTGMTHLGSKSPSSGGDTPANDAWSRAKPSPENSSQSILPSAAKYHCGYKPLIWGVNWYSVISLISTIIKYLLSAYPILTMLWSLDLNFEKDSLLG